METSTGSILKHIDASCPGCGYNLRGVLEAVTTICPECGESWAITQVLAGEGKNRRFRWGHLVWLLLPGLLGILLLFTSLFVESLGLSSSGWAQVITHVGTWTVLILAVPWVTIVAWDAVGAVNRRTPRQHMGALVLVLVMLPANAALFLIAFGMVRFLL